VDQQASSEYITAVKYRALFLSDIHLATPACRSEELLSFLRSHDAGVIYLVGDVVDFWRIRRGPRWAPSQTQVVKEFIAKARNGSRVVYIPGNHDDEVRIFAGAKLGEIEVRLRELHITASGRRFLVIHGDEFDVVMLRARWLAVLGDIGYELALAVNFFLNAIRRFLGLPYWSLSAYLKYRVKRAVNHFGHFETQLIEEARRVGAEGVICGHIHHASMIEVNGIQYVNTGDWVESCTAVVEHFDGRLEIIRWAEILASRKATATKARATSEVS
jgi:UDP-2,3-diacylglucosamine pyrophosphatase LpxH